jgi:hypothetical protein
MDVGDEFDVRIVLGDRLRRWALAAQRHGVRVPRAILVPAMDTLVREREEWAERRHWLAAESASRPAQDAIMRSHARALRYAAKNGFIQEKRNA